MGASRERDKRLLDLVRARASGLTTGQVAQAFDISTASVTIQTNKVMDADIEASGCENPTAIKAAYWPRKKG